MCSTGKRTALIGGLVSVLVVAVCVFVIYQRGAPARLLGRQTWPLSVDGAGPGEPPFLQLTCVVFAGLSLNVRASDGDVLLHVDLRHDENAVVFNHFLDGAWGDEHRRRLFFGQTITVNVTAVDASTVRIDLGSVARDFKGWMVFSLPSGGGHSFHDADSVELLCAKQRPCAAVESLLLVGQRAPVEHFPTSTDGGGLLGHVLDRLPAGQAHPDVRLFVGVMSAPDNFERRMAIRQSWMQQASELDVSVRFFLANSEHETVQRDNVDEQQHFGDVEILPYTDDYYAITKKTKAMVEFAVRNTTATHLLKCDDDSYVFLDRFVQLVASVAAERYLYLGNVGYGEHPHRNPASQWYIATSEYPSDSYPPFAHGPGYVLSRSLMEKLLEMWDDPDEAKHLPLLRLEDISTAVWVDHAKKAHGLDVKIHHDGRVLITGCNTKAVLAHYITAARMRCIWSRYSEQHPVFCCE